MTTIFFRKGHFKIIYTCLEWRFWSFLRRKIYISLFRKKEIHENFGYGSLTRETISNVTLYVNISGFVSPSGALCSTETCRVELTCPCSKMLFFSFSWRNVDKSRTLSNFALWGNFWAKWKEPRNNSSHASFLLQPRRGDSRPSTEGWWPVVDTSRIFLGRVTSPTVPAQQGHRHAQGRHRVKCRRPWWQHTGHVMLPEGTGVC